jgi:RNA polymerase sigma-70 factor (ECF subfamily)
MQTISALPLEGDCASVGDDAAQVQAAQGDPAAFAPLYRRYQDRVYRYLRTRTGQDEDAADLTQQVFLRALDSLSQYRPRRGSFAAWLFRIARNVATDWHRRQRRTVTWDLVPEALQPVADHDLEAGLLRREAVARLRALFDELDANKQEVLVLRFAAQLTIAEIAATIGKSEAATQKILLRTIQTLQESYHDAAP